MIFPCGARPFSGVKGLVLGECIFFFYLEAFDDYTCLKFSLKKLCFFSFLKGGRNSSTQLPQKNERNSGQVTIVLQILCTAHVDGKESFDDHLRLLTKNLL